MRRETAASLVLLLSMCVGSACSSSPDAATLAESSDDAADGAADAGGDAADASFDDPPIDAKYASFAAAFDAERKKLGAPGCAVALLEHAQVTFFHGFGTKGPKSTDAVRARTLFRIGSMTKALTATALLRLVDDGKVDLDAKLTSLVPDVAIDGTQLQSLTVRECLSHQSGLFDYLEIDASHDDAALSQFLTGSTYRADEYFMDPPGTFYDYSNPNFMLSGLAVERAGGVPYRQAMHDRVFAPLGMLRSFFLPSEVVADGDFSDGKSTDPSGAPWDVRPDSYDNAWARPAGYLFSNVLDYARFVAFLQSGDTGVLSDARRTAMQSRQVGTLEYGELEGYGFGIANSTGFFIGKSFYATTLVDHDGAIPGFASEFFLIPATGFGAVVFCNADGAYPIESIVQAMQSFGSLPAPSAPPDLANDPSTYPKIAGPYYDAHEVGHVTIATSNNQLTISMPDVDAAHIPYDKTLQPVGPNNFVLTIQGRQVEVTFLQDITGAYVWMRTRPFVAHAGTGPIRPPVQLDAAHLARSLRMAARAPSLARAGVSW